MIQLENDFFDTVPWGRQANTVHLFMFLLSRADSKGAINIDLRGMQTGMGVCCMSKIKFSLRQLELSGHLTIQKTDGKKTYIIQTDNDTKKQDARSKGKAEQPDRKKGLHTPIKW